MAMYKKGDAQWLRTNPRDGEYDCNLCDARDGVYPLPPGRYVTLPHSSDEWVIGMEENVQWMIDDLTEIMEEMMA